MSHNLAARSREERDRIKVEMQQPESLKEYFRDRLKFYREESMKFPRGSDPVYHKEMKE